jgi:hypothetical protein
MLITALVAPVIIPIAALVLVMALAKLERVYLDDGDRSAVAREEPDAPAEGLTRHRPDVTTPG